MTNGDCVGISEFEGSWWKGMFCTKHAPGTVINPLPSTSHCANVAGSWRYKNPADGQDWQEMTMVQDGCAGVISGFPDSVQTSVPFRSRVQSPGSSYYPFRLDFDSGFDYEMDDFQDPQPKTLKHKGYTFFKSEQQPVKEDPNDYRFKSQIYTGSDKPDLGNWVNGMMVVAECELGYYHPYPEQCRRVIEAYGATPLLMTNGDCVGISEFEGSWWKGMFCTKHAPGTVINPLPSTSHCANVAGSWRYKNPADGQDWQEMTMVQDGCAGVISGFPDSVQTSVPFRSRVQSPGSSYYPFRLDFDSGFDYEMDDFQDPQPKTLKHKGYTFFKSEQQPACANVAGTWWYHSAVAEYLQPMTIVQDGCAGVISGFPDSVGQTEVQFLSDEVQDAQNGVSYRLRFDLGSGYDDDEMGSLYDREPMIFEYQGFTFRKSIRQPETIFTYSADGNSNRVIGLVGTETFEEILEKIGKPLGLTFDKVRGSDLLEEFWKHNEEHNGHH